MRFLKFAWLVAVLGAVVVTCLTPTFVFRARLDRHEAEVRELHAATAELIRRQNDLFGHAEEQQKINRLVKGLLESLYANLALTDGFLHKLWGHLNGLSKRLDESDVIPPQRLPITPKEGGPDGE